MQINSAVQPHKQLAAFRTTKQWLASLADGVGLAPTERHRKKIATASTIKH